MLPRDVGPDLRKMKVKEGDFRKARGENAGRKKPNEA